MQKNLLNVSHLQQRADSDCLPVCVQMVLKYWEREESYENLVRLLGTRWFGTPVDNILRLSQLGIRVTIEELSLEEIWAYLQQDIPVMAFVSTADLSYWDTESDHVIVVIGMEEQWVYVNDPFFAQAPQQITRISFELAQLRFNNRCAVIRL
jgi:ABC-type bacteriocin/lantibiotic exporter with double-glycine peptidase domain